MPLSGHDPARCLPNSVARTRTLQQVEHSQAYHFAIPTANMPWPETAKMSAPGVEQWQAALKNAFRRRLSVEIASAALRELKLFYPASGEAIANVLMSFRADGGGPDDPLLFRYTEHFLRESYINSADLLWALLSHSQFSSGSGHTPTGTIKSSFPTCEERIFTILTRMHFSGALTVTPPEMHSLTFALTRWLNVTYEYEMAKQLENVGLYALDSVAYGMYESLGSLVLTIFGKASFRVVAKQSWWKQRRSTIVRELQNFDLQILQWMQSQLVGRLQALGKMPPFMETDRDGRPILTPQQILDSIIDLPIIRTRAGLYVWLNACLCGRPQMDDLAMLGYLQARYSGDIQTAIVDLLTAAFDVLTNALLCKERTDTVWIIRSFISNKIPTLLALLASYLAPPMTVENCIQMAFMTEITIDVLPPISEGDKDVCETLRRTRAEFLRACVLHGLMSESLIEHILQEPSNSQPAGTKFTKEGLLAQCVNNVGRLEPLLRELQSMRGNAGAVAECIVQLINNLYLAKDTMSLKTVCNLLLKRIPDLDILMQYTQPANLLLPLCTVLNDWTHDQDQAEFTPSYEEFASILLFTLAFIHRYNLTKADAEILPSGNFVFDLMQNISTSIPLSDLSEDQNVQLSKWIEGLFATDEHGETSGISDDVMRQCPPKDFYKLVPTLFEQSVLACRSNCLPMNTFKGGLELLLEPFLLPSLIGGLNWLIMHSWADHGDVDVLLHVLDKLLKPSSSSQDTQTMHKAILGMVATRLSYSLHELLRKQPDKRAATGLINLLKPYTDQISRRTYQSGRKELREWAAVEGGGLLQCIRSAVRELSVWIPTNPPPRYNHGQFLAACELCGADAVLSAISTELKEQTTSGNGAQTLDVCVALICSPTIATAKSDSVRHALRLVISDTQTMLQKPNAEAEAMIRLARRVEAQLAVPQLPLPISADDQVATDQLMHDLGFPDAVAGSTASALPIDTGSNIVQGSSMLSDFSAANLDSGIDTSMDITGSSAPVISGVPSDNALQMGNSNFFDFPVNLGSGQHSGPGQNADTGVQTQEEDIFAGLDMGGDLGDEDFNFT